MHCMCDFDSVVIVPYAIFIKWFYLLLRFGTSNKFCYLNQVGRHKIHLNTTSLTTDCKWHDYLFASQSQICYLSSAVRIQKMC